MLVIVATPIGNLDDISKRAEDTLRSADLIAAEDTRHSRRLLDHLGVTTPMVAYHDHNESAATERVMAELERGRTVALISDAGTPLVSDPGYRLVKAAQDGGISVSTVPGPCAAIAALSVAGLPTDRFCFEGFPPGKANARQAMLESLSGEPRTIVLFEAPHRIAALMDDIAKVMGSSRSVTLVRELTKTWEQIWHGQAGDCVAALASGQVPRKGEFVVVVAGSVAPVLDLEQQRVMAALLKELSPAAAASVASELLGVSRKQLYEVALTLKKG